MSLPGASSSSPTSHLQNISSAVLTPMPSRWRPWAGFRLTADAIGWRDWCHSRRRTGSATVSADETAFQAGSPYRRQVSPHRHPDQQLPALGSRQDLRSHPVQFRIYASPHRHHLSLRHVFRCLLSRSSRRSRRWATQTGTKERRMRCASSFGRFSRVAAGSASSCPVITSTEWTTVPSSRSTASPAPMSPSPSNRSPESKLPDSAFSKLELTVEFSTSERSRHRKLTSTNFSSYRPLGWTLGSSIWRQWGCNVFDPEVLTSLLLGGDSHDFGAHIIPEAIHKLNVHAFSFDGYWADIGTIQSFYQANLGLTDAEPRYEFYRPDWPIYTHPAASGRFAYSGLQN
jgi:hypothetical protein